MKKILNLLFAFVIFHTASHAQIIKIPAKVTTAFTNQYPTARQVTYKDALTSVRVEFMQDSSKMVALYNYEGDWKETQKELTMDSLPPAVKDGFKKSKYANDWKTEEVMAITAPGNTETYRFKVSKSDVQKKYLFFDKSGRLTRDSITL